ncbi:hypothetical protein, partial [Cereibacter changlensis]|uniref:hypothetical protein n=1 Tax=Cereibacter changlensis TaxID=402884 RepID=UPI001C63772E
TLRFMGHDLIFTGSTEALAVIGTIAEIYLVESRIRGLSAEAPLTARKAESATSCRRSRRSSSN